MHKVSPRFSALLRRLCPVVSSTAFFPSSAGASLCRFSCANARILGRSLSWRSLVTTSSRTTTCALGSQSWTAFVITGHGPAWDPRLGAAFSWMTRSWPKQAAPRRSGSVPARPRRRAMASSAEESEPRDTSASSSPCRGGVSTSLMAPLPSDERFRPCRRLQGRVAAHRRVTDRTRLKAQPGLT